RFLLGANLNQRRGRAAMRPRRRGSVALGLPRAASAPVPSHGRARAVARAFTNRVGLLIDGAVSARGAAVWRLAAVGSGTEGASDDACGGGGGGERDGIAGAFLARGGRALPRPP